MKLIFERSVKGRKGIEIPECDIAKYSSTVFNREDKVDLPEIAEIDLIRHYTELSTHAYGVDNGFYPLGSCTMKYNPKVNEAAASLEDFCGIHPLQPLDTAKGCKKLMDELSDSLCSLTGMDSFTLQPAAGAHGEFTGIQLIKAYFADKGDYKRNKILVPDSAHGTNPASANMCGFTVVSIPSNADGGVDIEQLAKAVGEDTAGLMLTNPNTLGLFDKNILEITKIVHNAGGLNYYDGANFNAIMGICRPGDMGFDVIHLNLHKTFSTPHGGGGPGSGPVGCKSFLQKFLPIDFCCSNKDSIGRVRSFYGNFGVIVKAFTYIKTLGADGLKDASQKAVLNANYLKTIMKEYPSVYNRICMHEFVVSMEELKHDTGVSALDIAKAMLDEGIHPPTMYFPLIVHEALMFEPTETESKETLDNCAEVMSNIYKKAVVNSEELHNLPLHTYIRRVDEVKAARQPILKYDKK